MDNIFLNFLYDILSFHVKFTEYTLYRGILKGIQVLMIIKTQYD
jgi:hypothetical protein